MHRFLKSSLYNELLLVVADADAQRGEGSDDVAQLKTGKRKRSAGVKSYVEKNKNDDTCKTSYSHWLMKSEPESRIENGVDVKVNRLFCACVHCFDLFVCLLAKILLKTKIQHTKSGSLFPPYEKEGKNASVNQNHDISHTYDNMSAFFTHNLVCHIFLTSLLLSISYLVVFYNYYRLVY